MALLVVLLWNVENVPKTDAKILQIQNLLFLAVLMRRAGIVAHQSATGSNTKALVLERWAMQLFLMVHIVMTFLVWKISGAKDESNKKSFAKQLVSQTSKEDDGVPDLLYQPPFHEKAKVA